MRKNGLFVMVVMGAVLSLGPLCDSNATIEQSCEHLCECAYVLPNDQLLCQQDCATLLEAMPQACLDCIDSADCFDLKTGDACADECQ